MGNEIAPFAVDYTNPNPLGTMLNLPHLYGVISNDLISGKWFQTVGVPLFGRKKRSLMQKDWPRGLNTGKDLHLPPWGQRRIRTAAKPYLLEHATMNQQNDEIIRGK